MCLTDNLHVAIFTALKDLGFEETHTMSNILSPLKEHGQRLDVRSMRKSNCGFVIKRLYNISSISFKSGFLFANNTLNFDYIE